MDESLVAVPLPIAARLVGMTERRLAEWDERGFLTPTAKRQLSERNTVRLYEFGDLIEIRVALALIDQRLSLPHVERVIGYLRKARGFGNPLRELAFAVVRGKIFFKLPDGTWEGEVRPRQVVFHSVLNLEVIREEMAQRLRDNQKKLRRAAVERRRKVLGHKEVFAGTRTPIEAVLSFLASGASDEEILEAYPHLTPDDINLARSLATSA